MGLLHQVEAPVESRAAKQRANFRDIVRVQHEHRGSATASPPAGRSGAPCRGGNFPCFAGFTSITPAIRVGVGVREITESDALRPRPPDGDRTAREKLDHPARGGSRTPRSLTLGKGRASRHVLGEVLLATGLAPGSPSAQKYCPPNTCLTSVGPNPPRSKRRQRPRREQRTVLVEEVPRDAVPQNPLDARRLEEHLAGFPHGRAHGAQKLQRIGDVLDDVPAHDGVGFQPGAILVVETPLERSRPSERYPARRSSDRSRCPGCRNRARPARAGNSLCRSRPRRCCRCEPHGCHKVFVTRIDVLLEHAGAGLRVVVGRAVLEERRVESRIEDEATALARMQAQGPGSQRARRPGVSTTRFWCTLTRSRVRNGAGLGQSQSGHRVSVPMVDR